MKTNQSKRPETLFTARDNEYRHIFFVPTRGDYRLSVPGRETTFHDSLTAAIRVRDFCLSEPAEPGPKPLNMNSYLDYQERETR
jgi:hypothetical protein